MLVKATLPDGAVREYAAGVSVERIAESISPGLKKNAVAGKINGKAVDLSVELNEDAAVEIITLDSADGLEVLRHSAAHL
ncbi:MAG: TGS domain-containing protein, partial [Gorillibacterium sp.]|nr:TGS domain-containing protein [Gorillibacterium sp.]